MLRKCVCDCKKAYSIRGCKKAYSTWLQNSMHIIKDCRMRCCKIACSHPFNQISGALSDTLQYVRVPVITNRECRKFYDYDLWSMICAGYPGKGGKDACLGDSGGPLVCATGGKAVLVGVVSWGFECASPYFPGVYSRTKGVLDFIQCGMVSSGHIFQRNQNKPNFKINVL